MMKVAIMGFGVVGSGVAEVIHNNARKISASAANDIELKYILDLRDFPQSPFSNYIIKDFSLIEKDDEVKVVAECMGGTGAAYDFTKRLLLAGKSVVTSNKELVATHGAELLRIARESNANYLFEASVGGGIPIIRPMAQCLSANEITEIFGILNGTTNYILSRMIEAGAGFEEALAEAQQLGYAEKDPTADVEGHDTCRKICILSALAFGKHVYPESVPTEGITTITPEDVRLAERAGYKIKLLGRSVARPGGRVTAYVAPHLIGQEHQLASVSGVFNGIVVRGNVIDEVMFYGRGAGKLPTASAVVADIIDASKHMAARKYLSWEDAGREIIDDGGELVNAFYVRAAAPCDGVDFGQTTRLSDRAFITKPMSWSRFGAMLKELEKTVEVKNCFKVLV